MANKLALSLVFSAPVGTALSALSHPGMNSGDSSTLVAET